MIKRMTAMTHWALAMLLLMSSCEKDNSNGNPTDTTNYTYGRGVFIVNEGAFGQGSGSVSFLNMEYQKMYDDIFYAANNRPLGDIAQSMEIFNNQGYIVVNNSGTLEVVNLHTFKSIASISNLASPRNTLIIDESKGYITHLTEGKLSIFNPISNSLIGEVPTGKSCENILYAEGKVFVTNWSNFFVPANNNTIQIIDAVTDQVTDSIVVSKEPNSMVLDKNNKIWVLCSGGFMNEEVPALYRIDPVSLSIEKKFDFPDISTSPVKLSLNGSGDTLYYLNTGAYKMSISSASLPDAPFIFDQNIFFYSLGVDPQNGMTLLSDAVDFNQKGVVYRYTKGGQQYDHLPSGIVPSAFCYTP